MYHSRAQLISLPQASKKQQEDAEPRTATTARPEMTAPAKKAAEKVAKVKEQREKTDDDWEQVTSRRTKKAEAEPAPDAAAIEAMTLAGDARADDSAGG